MTIPYSDTPTIGLGQFLKEARFFVPSHQRDYSWTEEYVKQFIDDVVDALDRKNDLYFCGLMVFTQGDPPAFQVLDGQQRLATTLMIVSAIRNWLSQYSAHNKAKTQIEERYLGDSELGETTIEPKLKLNAANNDNFRAYVIDLAPLDDIKKAAKSNAKDGRNKALFEAIVYTNDRTREIADGFSRHEEAAEYLLSLIKYLNDTVKIVRLVVKGDEAAYTIFETLNDRGLDLAPLDLVKNYLFSKAEKAKGKSLRDLEERWTEMMTLISGVKADSFLRAFWASRHGTLEGRKLFGAFKREYSDSNKAYNVSVQMRQSADHYVALANSNDPVWAKHTAKAKKSIEALATIGVTQVHPILLSALYRNFDSREMERLLWLLEVVAVRYQLVARGRPGRIESLGGRTAKGIFDGKLTTATQIFAELKELYIADQQFQLDFENKTERESKKAVLLLAGLEEQQLLQRQDAHAKETVPSGAITIEHILPKSPGASWKTETDADPDLLTDCLYRLGNLCLLSNVNRALGNKAFADKKKVFATSKLLTTQSLGQYTDWNRRSIERRQKQLAKLAVAQWRFQ